MVRKEFQNKDVETNIARKTRLMCTTQIRCHHIHFPHQIHSRWIVRHRTVVIFSHFSCHLYSLFVPDQWTLSATFFFFSISLFPKQHPNDGKTKINRIYLCVYLFIYFKIVHCIHIWLCTCYIEFNM